MNRLASILALLMITATFSGCLGFGDGESSIFSDDPTPLKINHVQVKGTHNSYHIKPFGPTARAYEYTHEPLDVQAGEFDVRQFELDVWWDPRGDLRVYHNQYDSRSTCNTLADCLGVLNTWSDANPAHVPLMIWVEPKEWVEQASDITAIAELQGMLEKIEEEIKQNWPDEKLITPDDVRGEAASLSEAVTTNGWPLLEESRGKAIFILLAGGGIREEYHQNFPGLVGSTMFTMSVEGTPEAAIFSNTDPIGNGDQIRNLVEEGYIVRSRADDAEDGEADSNNTARLEAAIASGAHSISTDYPAKVEDIDYWVEFPATCNPVTAPPDCTAERIESSSIPQT
ncbi:MAG: hypothetical protein CMA61_00315 [Euryarchaeota archaeon]|nr:hypothetical protein [Euryarchaeota archaeon]